MDTDVAILERLVPAGDVLDLLAREHDRRGSYANFETCQRVALETILARLRDGNLEAWSTCCNIDSTIDTGPTIPGQIISGWDFHRHQGSPAKVPSEFWFHYHYAGEQSRTYDSVAGDFRFQYLDEQFSSRDGAAYAVYFDQKGLPPISAPSWHPSIATMPAKRMIEPAQAHSGKGRSPANWWPDFAEELAVYLHDNGPPETQEAMIAGVQLAMVAKGKPEPSRTQIQPVIRAIFARIGPAGK